jgi:hypothetical protein
MLRHARLSLKLFTGQRWEKLAFPIVLDPKADRLLAAPGRKSAYQTRRETAQNP